MIDHSDKFADLLKKNMDTEGLLSLYGEIMAEIATIEALLEECFMCDEGVCYHERPMKGDLPDADIECPSLRGMEDEVYRVVGEFNNNPRIDVAIQLGLGFDQPKMVNQILSDFKSRMDERDA